MYIVYCIMTGWLRDGCWVLATLCDLATLNLKVSPFGRNDKIGITEWSLLLCVYFGTICFTYHLDYCLMPFGYCLKLYNYSIVSVLSYGMGFRVRDCSGNPFVFLRKKQKIEAESPTRRGTPFCCILKIVYCIMYNDGLVSLGLHD